MLAIRRLWQRLFRAFDTEAAHAEARDRGELAPHPVQGVPATGATQLVATRSLFALSPELLAALRATRAWCDYEDRVIWEHDAFLLDPGDDAPSYLSADGRVLWLQRQTASAPTHARVFAALVMGARQTGVADLLALLPARSQQAQTCAPCGGSGFRHTGQGAESSAANARAAQRAHELCPTCAGLGWTSPELDLRAPLSA